MPRFRRLVVPGYPHHVTQRGVRRHTTFFDARDYRTYRRLALDLLDDARIELLAYCLMPNHIHAVVVPLEEHGLARFFGPLHKRYAQLTNMRYEWTGHLWQARFYSVVMHEEHALAAMRYVELNPVRSGLVSSPEDWPWSSARGNLGLVNDELLFDHSARKNTAYWSEFLATPEDPTQLSTLRRQTTTGRPGGDPKFIDSIESLSGRRVRPHSVGRKKR